jgi:hypothetical protein
MSQQVLAALMWRQLSQEQVWRLVACTATSFPSINDHPGNFCYDAAFICPSHKAKEIDRVLPAAARRPERFA